ncbi:MAG TPA: asparagine synthase (glutamine-hydrolyzing), partial [Limnochordia bacterium]
MCGIAGWVDWERDLEQEIRLVEAMAAAVACRGPDAAASWCTRHAAFGHRRLIVIDPLGGNQPMHRRHRGTDYTLVYNGELYNTAELRRELSGRGHTFQGHSDTEVLLAAWAEWGPDCLDRLNGIFAFAVWDAGAEALYLARDRLGVKPLFFAERGSGLLFGSELKALLAHPAVRAEIGADGLAEVFALGPARTPGHGIFRGVREVLPGTWLRYHRGGLSAHRYWALESRPHPDDLETTAARVRELVIDSVERQLISDVPICTLLSGGLDSSGITAAAAAAFRRAGADRLTTYAVDYAQNDRHFQPNPFQPEPDGPWIRRVAAYLDTAHRDVVLAIDALAAALLPAMRARDLPGMADIDSSLLLFCRAIKEGATVALSGECADEVFGGYPWFRRPDALAAQTFPWSLKLDLRLSVLSQALIEHIRPAEYVAERYAEALAEVPRLPTEAPDAARRREIAYLTLTRWMPVLLDRKDRMSMAAGLEVRVPYCDHRLVEYAWNIPWEMKECGGREKGILRRALTGLLPDDVLQRKKSPYPKTHHPAYLDTVRRLLGDVLADP